MAIALVMDLGESFGYCRRVLLKAKMRQNHHAVVNHTCFNLDLAALNKGEAGLCCIIQKVYGRNVGAGRVVLGLMGTCPEVFVRHNQEIHTKNFW